jgi:hypothetical protein
VAIKNTCVIVIIMIAGFVSVPQVVHASPPSNREKTFLDGIGTCFHRANPSCSWQVLKTTKEEDVVILVAWCYCQSETLSVIDTKGLDYALRVSYTTSFPNLLTVWEYYAAADSPLTYDNITVLSALCQECRFPQRPSVGVFAIHPGDTNTVFDPTPSLPITVTCAAQPCSASVDRLSQDFVIAITPINDAGPCPAPASSGFSELVFDGSSLDIDYRIVREPENDVTFTCAVGDTDLLAIVLDAISLYPGDSESSRISTRQPGALIHNTQGSIGIPKNT